MASRSGAVYICGGEVGTAARRDAECPNALHDWPTPTGYVDASVEASWRLDNGWSNTRCPECRTYGWRPGRTTEEHIARANIRSTITHTTEETA